MEKVYAKAKNEKTSLLRHSDDPIDAGVELQLLQNRRSDGTELARPSNRGSGRGRTLRQQNLAFSQMLEDDEVDRRRATASTVKTRRNGLIQRDAEEEPEQELASSTSRPRRTTRTRKARSPTPRPTIERHSEKYGLGTPWDQPVVYPESGKKRVTVDFKDLERLDDGEFLNDNIIEFYIRWLQVNCEVKDKSAYFFGTHFFTTVADTSGIPKDSKVRGINYKAVERWTAKDDIFSYDYVIVPINEMAHWYLAIICNLPNVQRKMASQDDAEGEEPSQESADNAINGSQAQPMDISESTERQREEDVDAVAAEGSANAQGIEGHDVPQEHETTVAEETTPTRGVSKQCGKLSLSDPKSAADPHAIPDSTEEKPGEVSSLAERAATPKADEQVELPDSQPPVADGSQVSGVFANAVAPSPEKKQKVKRKSGPGPKKYGADQPMIVIIDPMANPHGRAISVLKQYLVEEASQKRAMDITVDVFQGMNAKKGIPQQTNYYDCGIYVIGYLHKFMSNPQEFGRKLLSQEFDLETDWPQMEALKMRGMIRKMLQDIAKEQQDARAARKKEKRVAKRQSGSGGVLQSSPVKPDNGIVDLSSPPKPRVEQDWLSPPTKPELPPRNTSPVKSSIEQRRSASPTKLRSELARSSPMLSRRAGSTPVIGGRGNIFEEANRRAGSPAKRSTPKRESPAGIRSKPVVEEEVEDEMLHETEAQPSLRAQLQAAASHGQEDESSQEVHEISNSEPDVERVVKREFSTTKKSDSSAPNPEFAIYVDSQDRSQRSEVGHDGIGNGTSYSQEL